MTDSVLGVGAGSQQAALEKEPPPASRRQVPAFLRRSPTLRLFGKRLLMAIPVLLGVSFITFSLMNLLPGDAATAMAGESASKAQLQAMRVRLHLNLPFFDRYIHWLGSALTGQLGTSFASGTSVTSIIGGRLPVTAELVVGAVILSLIFSIPVALLAARHPRAVVDRLNIFVSMFGYSVPNFVLALLLILVFAVHLHLAPAIGFVPIATSLWGNLHSMVLPCCALGFAHFCGYTRLLRADLIDQLRGRDYILTARSKGLSESRVLIFHALRNALSNLITVIGINLGAAIGGTVILETIFALPGMGAELISSIASRDVPVVEGIVVVIACAVVLTNLVVDLLYALLDPRIRYGRSSS
jgi:peptide/nickel transport system permease protein